MKVDDVFGEVLEEGIPLYETFGTQEIIKLLELRKATFTGFAALEKDQGFITPTVNFSTSKGQEMLRIMLFRVIEECVESFESVDPNHIKEEAIDAMNYLLSALMLDHTLFPAHRLADHMLLWSKEVYEPSNLYRLNQPLTEHDISAISICIGGKLADTFRNRAWMNRAQTTLFEGYYAFVEAAKLIMGKLFTTFSSWEEFYTFFVAKDKVLQFRLKSRY